MVNRQTRSSRARRVPRPAATKSNRVANYKVHFQVSRGVQLENSISATDETSGRRSSRGLFSRPWRPPPSVIRRDSRARDGFRCISYVENPVALPVLELCPVWFPPSHVDNIQYEWSNWISDQKKIIISEMKILYVFIIHIFHVCCIDL